MSRSLKATSALAGGVLALTAVAGGAALAAEAGQSANAGARSTAQATPKVTRPQTATQSTPMLAAGSYQYFSASFTNTAGVLDVGSVGCPRRLHVTGGGVSTSSGLQVLNESGPIDSGDPGAAPDDRWRVFVQNNDTFDASFTVWVICHR